MNMIEILEQQAQYVSNSGYDVHVNVSMGWVTIQHNEDEELSIFLQGEDARIFINEYLRLYEELQHIGNRTLALALAMPYIDSMV